jgi:hypothetical protein
MPRKAAAPKKAHHELDFPVSYKKGVGALAALLTPFLAYTFIACHQYVGGQIKLRHNL